MIIITERLGGDNIIYVITYARSNKIKHIEKNPTVAIAGDWSTAHGLLLFHGKRYDIEFE